MKHLVSADESCLCSCSITLKLQKLLSAGAPSFFLKTSAPLRNTHNEAMRLEIESRYGDALSCGERLRHFLLELHKCSILVSKALAMARISHVLIATMFTEQADAKTFWNVFFSCLSQGASCSFLAFVSVCEDLNFSQNKKKKATMHPTAMQHQKEEEVNKQCCKQEQHNRKGKKNNKQEQTKECKRKWGRQQQAKK